LLAILSISEMVCFSALFCAREIVVVDCRADTRSAPRKRDELAVMLTVLDTLPVRLERGCMLGHVI
jgi:hypothetical protein